ncbi:MAG TPA: TIGR01777 family oxidoreductase [Candidatus Baltobacteraceae bacterium]|nr:TIGR01777 family oxidoreductase [Candidatus Baltobacteraceae bacterium]
MASIASYGGGPSPESKKNIHRVVLPGGSGFLGRALAGHFLEAGWDVVILTRSPNPNGNRIRESLWDGCTIGSWHSELDGATAVVNLTGKSVNCRYNAGNRKEILESRVNATRVVGEAIGRCANPPPVWLNASTATVYKHTFGNPWDESGEIEAASEAKDAFSVEVAQAWEGALEKAVTPRTRKVAMRMGMVVGLDKNSVFPVLRRLVRLGLGGKMGRGDQYVSWMHVVDYCRAVEWLISHENLRGPVNVVAPNPVPNREMMRILRQVCGAPFGLPAAEWMLEIGAVIMRTETELIIKSRRVIPGRLLESGFQFRFPTLEEAFRDLSGADANVPSHR